jgi:hypothetical protein
VHIRLGPDGGIDLTTAAAQTVDAATPLRSVTRPGGLWRHRWGSDTVRSDGGIGELAHDGVESLFIACDGTVLECGYGNVFLLLAEGTLITPPLRDDLLPGVTRRALLDYARDEARPVQIRGFDRTEMTANTAFWTNSLSGAVPIASVDGATMPQDDELIAAFARHLVDARP